MIHEIHQRHFLVLHDFLTVTPSNWQVDESLEMELHLQALLVLIDHTFTASFVAVFVLVCLYFR